MNTEQQFDAKAIADLNALPKREGARKPWGNVHFIAGHGGWWAECPTTGRGYWFALLADAVCAWLVTITECKQGVLVATPTAA